MQTRYTRFQPNQPNAGPPSEAGSDGSSIREAGSEPVTRGEAGSDSVLGADEGSKFPAGYQ